MSNDIFEEIGETFYIHVPRITGSVSLVSSVVIIYVIFRSFSKLNCTYHRIMLGMSLGDIIMSLAIVLAQNPMPRPGISEAVDLVFPPQHRLGTVLSCNLQGFLFTVGANLSYLYNGALSWYYYCIIVKTMKHEFVQKRVEPFLHGITVFFSLIIGIVFYVIKAYNPGLAWCTARISPFDCLSDCDSERVSVSNYHAIVIPMIFSVLGISISSMVFCLSSVYLKISSMKKILHREMEEKYRQHQEDVFSGKKRWSEHYMQKKVTDSKSFGGLHLIANKTIAFQAMVYVSSCLITSGAPILRNVLIDISKTKASFSNTLRFQLIVQPLQGLFNLLIFIGFKIHNQKRMNPNVAYLEIFRWIFFQSTSDPIYLSVMTIVQQQSIQRKEMTHEVMNFCHDGSMEHMDLYSDSASELGTFDKFHQPNGISLQSIDGSEISGINQIDEHSEI